ncbi:hypothetical protein BB560_002330 [Smittium megazygosporum]|uniref:RNA polymerase II subunit A C-terminal domain phosphatase SSU72 n=1 Tax=Smittium megazygosporum TaxID=133381 RepID=A0A2T9ZF65_9FUNG|nr:hypothetical protein BB560_002330 [Smittium megazygosporum]
MVRFAVVCASNMNRSMEGHLVLSKDGKNVQSFGTGTKVRLPGDSIDRPLIYDFGTPYKQILSDVTRKNPSLYKKNGLLEMLSRNINLKQAPMKFQSSFEVFDVIITCEERCFDAVCLELLSRGGKLSKPVHLINVEIKDNHSEASKGGSTIKLLADLIEQASDLDSEIQNILQTVQAQTSHELLYNYLFY